MASARIGELPPPQVDRAMAQPAYGMRALPKLQEELQGQDASAQLRALCLLQVRLLHFACSLASRVCVLLSLFPGNKAMPCSLLHLC